METTETKMTAFEVKLLDTSTDAETRTFNGYGAVFNNSDSYGDTIKPGAFTRTLAEHKAAGTRPAMLWNHNSCDMPIGTWLSLEEDTFGLKVEGQLLATTTGNDAYVALKGDAVTGLSIGFIVTGYDIVQVNGVAVREITEVRLIEVSLVTFPANDLARVGDIKAADGTCPNCRAPMLVKSEEDCIAETTDGNEADETKYDIAAIEAVRALTQKLKEIHG